ncbi:hypothetical protein [Paraburkholderia sediminicola]|uniref:hypothetical protein n=1 Tax=Paraburkholderia sediminicola TaxID=458836 RepID=UPI0038B79AA2
MKLTPAESELMNTLLAKPLPTDYMIIPNTNPDLRAVLVLHGPEVKTFPVIAWRVNAETGTNLPLLAGGLQIAEGESLENWALCGYEELQDGGRNRATVYPLDPGALPTKWEAFVARNAPDTLGE